MTDMLRRGMAPVTDEAWKEIDLQAGRTLKGNLSARKLVDVSGPHGWTLAAVNLGTLAVGKEETKGVTWGTREVLPLVEVRVPFSLKVWELDNVTRGAKAPDLNALIGAARKTALFEEQALYLGFPGGGIQGIVPASPHKPVAFKQDADSFAAGVETAILAIEKAGIGGPYALVLGTAAYEVYATGNPAAYPLKKRIDAMASGGVHWSPVVEGGVVLSRRGGDFELTLGQDLSIGYKTHGTEIVELYFTESFAFRVLEPAAAVALKTK